MKASTFFLLFSLLFGLTAKLRAGPVGELGERCLCQKTQQELRQHAVMTKANIFHPSPSCSKTEIVVTLKKGWKVCLDPYAKQGQMILSGQKLKPNFKPQKQGGKSKQQNGKKNHNKKKREKN
ncbi:C-X-C motif chemokine 9-like isoform X2 [Trichomycterus rosablanca]